MAATNGRTQQAAEVYESVSIMEFRKNERECTVDWFGKPIRFKYRPGSMDAEHFDQLEADAGKLHREWLKGYFLRIVPCIPSLTNDDGSPFEITEESIALVPIPLQNKIVDAITVDMTPKEEPESSSNVTSSPTAAGA